MLFTSEIPLTLFARHFAVLKSVICLREACHACRRKFRNSPVLTQPVATALENRVRQDLTKNPQTCCDINKKIVAVFILHIYIYSSIRHILQSCLSMKIYFGSRNSRSIVIFIQENFSITHKSLLFCVSYSTIFKLIFVYYKHIWPRL